MTLPRKVVEWLIFGPEATRRYTQDSPVLPDVWIRYGEAPTEPRDLLLVPHRQARTGRVAQELRESLRDWKPPRSWPGKGQRSHEVAATPSTVVARVWLDELVGVVLPQTRWWADRIRGRGGDGEVSKTAAEADLVLDPDRLVEALDRLETTDPESDVLPGDDSLARDLLWMIRLVGWLVWSRDRELPVTGGWERALLAYLDRRAAGDGVEAAWKEARRRLDREATGEGAGEGEPRPPSPRECVEGIRRVLHEELPPAAPADAEIFLVNLNRPAHLAVNRSRKAVKADAARRLFNIRCDHLRWAVVDSGVDATHAAFLEPPAPEEGGEAARDEGGTPDWARRTRVVETYDFTVLRKLLDPTNLRRLTGKKPPEDPELRILYDRVAAVGEDDRKRLQRDLEDLKSFLTRGRDVDWAFLAPILQVPHDRTYRQRPAGSHGTHVAGILAGGPEAEREPAEAEVRQGVAPDLRLYDLRVFTPDGRGDEFGVIAALQFVRWLNARQEYPLIHGVNLSLSIKHDVANYACGRTPVCEEAERLVSAGVVVVAAAGNRGFVRYQTLDGPLEGYHTVSVTDPGNAEGVITVGATHRDRPHTYGVSYFSSRGPTGDGRIKPDLVAPGEKIESALPGNLYGTKDGTSMAAPHVAGAAALLMGRHDELVGDPVRIKRILCTNATDLGRERYFQGSGMLDVLRALQSI